MNREDLFEAWAPTGGRWTPWAKAVLFATADAVEPAPPPAASWVSVELFTLDARLADYRGSARPPVAAVVVDLPGAEGVAVGLALARLGFRPVPLYNALAAPGAFVPMHDVVRALLAGAAELGARPAPPDAPPAFLLDSRRAGEGLVRREETFDNRSIVSPTDFPSAARLLDEGIGAAVLVQRDLDAPRTDLARVLAAWQQGGLELALVRADEPDRARSLRVRRPGLLEELGLWWRRATLRGTQRDGFGAAVHHVG